MERMKIVNLTDAIRKPDTRKMVIEAMRKGDIFAYPTDTVYGLGCNAEMSESVDKIARAKGREDSKNFSVIAPGMGWIARHSVIGKANLEFADKVFPGPYTIIVNAGREIRKTMKAVISMEKSLGIRIPNHPISEIVEEAGIPFITTSANISGEEPVTTIRDIPDQIRDVVDLAINAGTIEGYSSRVFDLRSSDVKILRY